MNAAWPLLNKYNIPDDARITEDNLNQYYNFISEKDTAKALRIGKRLQSSFAQFPEFWFHLGLFYLENGNAEEARTCFEKCETLSRPILRKNTLAAANARYKIFTLKANEKDEAKRLVDIIAKQSANDDWNNILFAALQNYQLGNKKQAEDLLYQNIDNGYDVPLNTEILKQIKAGKLDLNGIQSVAVREFNEPTQLEKLAQAGNADAQKEYGIFCYNNGNLKEANSWLEKSAKHGNFFAKCALARYNPEKYKKDLPEIVKKLQKLSDEGSNEAQFFLAAYYAEGIGVPKNDRLAFELYTESAEAGFANAQNNLGITYANGYGVPKDLVKAVEWYRKAADQGYAPAQNKLGVMYQDGLGVSKDLAKAVVWYQKAAEQGLASAQSNLGHMYDNGWGIEKDLTKAAEWYQKAAEQGSAQAQNNLGYKYQYGAGVDKDLLKAVELFGKAAEQGDAFGQNNLGIMYQNGLGVSKDLDMAMKLYQKAAEQGHPYAQYNIGILYHYGLGVPKDLSKAAEWYQKASGQGIKEAQDALQQIQ